MSKTTCRRRNRKRTKPLELLGDLAWKAATHEVSVANGSPNTLRQQWNTNKWMRAASLEAGITPVGAASFERHIGNLWKKRDLQEIMRLAAALCR